MTILATKLTGIGTDVTTAETVKQAMELSNLAWDVTLEPLKGAVTGKLVDNQAVLRLDTQEYLGVVGPQYTPLQNSEVFNFFEPFIENKLIQFETAGCFYGGRKIFVLGKVNMDDLEIQKDDVVQSYVLISNSHDGTTAVRVGFTPVRIWCLNTLKLVEADKASRLIRIRHTNQVKPNFNEMQNVIDIANQQFITTAENYRWLASRDFVQSDLEKYVKQVFSTKSLEKLLEDGEEGDNGNQKAIEYVENRMEFEDNKNWWTLYNSVQHKMQHDGNDTQRQYSNLWFGRNDSRNQKALNLALSMAV